MGWARARRYSPSGFTPLPMNPNLPDPSLAFHILDGVSALIALGGGALAWLIYRRRNRPLKATGIKVFGRLKFLAMFDGISMIAVGGISFLICLVLLDWSGLLVSAGITGAGVFEVMGCLAVAGGDLRGLRKMIQAQTFILGGGALYFILQGVFLSSAGDLKQVGGTEQATLVNAGVDTAAIAQLSDSLGHFLYAGCFITLVAAQGSLLSYYWRCRPALGPYLAQRFGTPPPLVSTGHIG